MPHMAINGGNLFYEEKGEGFPVVFSHSYMWDNKMWQEQINALSETYRCISIDLWNHGQSGDYPHQDFSIEQCAEDYWAFTQALGLKQFAFLGLSVGGMIGAHLAVNHPESVKALALVGTYIGLEPEESKEQYKQLLNQYEVAQHFSEELIQMVTPFFFSPVTLEKNPSIIKNFQQALADMPRQNMKGLVELGRAILLKRNSLLDRLPELSVPTLVMVGNDDIARPPHESKLMADLIPNAKLEVIKDAGHICAVEKPEFVSEQLKELLARL